MMASNPRCGAINRLNVVPNGAAGSSSELALTDNQTFFFPGEQKSKPSGTLYWGNPIRINCKTHTVILKNSDICAFAVNSKNILPVDEVKIVFLVPGHNLGFFRIDIVGSPVAPVRYESTF